MKRQQIKKILKGGTLPIVVSDDGGKEIGSKKREREGILEIRTTPSLSL